MPGQEYDDFPQQSCSFDLDFDQDYGEDIPVTDASLGAD